MSVTKITKITATGIPLLRDDIDTDRIIPARFLRCVTFDGLGEHAFEDDRRQDATHVFDQPQFRKAGVLVAGRNFGCGSSREHAPQSLMRWGIRAIMAESFAEIFFGNCSSLGIPAVCARRPDLEALAAAIARHPESQIEVDLGTLTVTADGLSIPITMPESAREALVTGQWDYLGRLLEATDQVRSLMSAIPYLNRFPSN